MQPITSLRYVRATLITVCAVALVPAVFLGIAYSDYRSPNWDPVDDSGAVQGFMFIAAAAALSIAYSGIAFPLAARWLHARGRFTGANFIITHAVWLAFASLLAAAGTSLLLGEISVLLPFALLLFGLSAMLSLPFTALWLWLAK